jgi:hypothetical protein
MSFRNILLLSISIVMIASCKKEKDPQLVNTWSLIEVLADPGDGSGTFQPVTSDKTIEFFNDGTVSSNGILCQMSSDSGTGSAGTYDATEMTITPNNCGVVAFVIFYELSGEHLILSYPCFEACREKYEVVN